MSTMRSHRGPRDVPPTAAGSAGPTLRGLCVATVVVMACGGEPAPAPADRVAVVDTVGVVSFVGLPQPRPSAPVAVSPDRAKIAVALGDDSGEILVFDGEGALTHQFGRAGGGPGEFREVSALTFGRQTDSLWVLDQGNQRLSVVAPGADRPAREIPLAGRQFFGVAWASDTTLVVQGTFDDTTTPMALGRAVHPGGITPTLIEDEAVDANRVGTTIRPVTPSSTGGIWAGHFREPTLRRIGEDLVETAVVRYPAPLLDVVPKNAEVWATLIDTEPAILGITEDAEGDLWVLFGVPADPLPSVENPQAAVMEGRVGAEDLARRVLARYEPGAFDSGPADQIDLGPANAGVLPDGLVYVFDADELGEATITIVRLHSRPIQE